MPRVNKKRRTQETTSTSRDDETVCVVVSSSYTSYKNSFFKHLGSLLDEDKLCDVTFRIKEHSFRAHRIVLAASNSTLGVMMLANMQESTQSIINLSDVDPQLFRFILDYIYGKTIHVPANLISPLLKLSNYYGMPMLRDRLAEYLKSTVTIWNCCDMYVLADDYGCTELKNLTLNMIYSYFGAVCQSNSFLDLPQPQLEFLLTSDAIIDCDEYVVFDAATRWLKHHFNASSTSPSQSLSLFSSPQSITNVNDSNQHILHSILKLIRFSMMSSVTLSEKIKRHEFMQGNNQRNLLLEAFECHALKAAGVQSYIQSAVKPRKKTCAFTGAQTLEGHTDSVSALVCYGNRLFTGSWDTTIKIWERNDRTRNIPSPTNDFALTSPNVNGYTASSSPITERAMDNHDSIIGSLGESKDWEIVGTLTEHSGAIRSLCICNHKVVSCSDDGLINVWDPATLTIKASMDAHDGAVNSIIEVMVPRYGYTQDRSQDDTYTSMQSDQSDGSHISRLVSSGDDGTIRIWNSTTWKCEMTLPNAVERNSEQTGDEPANLRVGVLSLETWKTYLFSGGDDSIVRVWSVIDWTCIHMLRSHEDEVWALKVLSDGTLLTGSVDTTIRIWKCHASDTSPNPLSASTSSSSSSYVDAATTLTYSSMEDSNAVENGIHVSPTRSVSSRHGNSSNANNESQGSGNNLVSITAIDSSNPLAKFMSWECVQAITSDGPVYSLSYLDNRFISAGASKQISVWGLGPIYNDPDIYASKLNPTQAELNTWSLVKQFDTTDDGVWSLTLYKQHLISGGCDGSVLFWE